MGLGQVLRDPLFLLFPFWEYLGTIISPSFEFRQSFLAANISPWRDNKIDGQSEAPRWFDLPALQGEISGFIDIRFKTCSTESCGKLLISIGIQECQRKPQIKIKVPTWVSSPSRWVKPESGSISNCRTILELLGKKNWEVYLRF
jgi:hypothetical protein